MKTRRSLYLAISAMLMAMLACGPSGVVPTPDLTATFGVALTAAFATAQGNLPPPSATGVSVAEATATTTVPADTTATAAPSVTASPTACTNAANFVSDVTIPDGTQFAAPSAFTKTWRIQNSGTCTWSPTYTLKFAAGAQMGGPAAVAFPSNVAPNATMDISVSLTSPAAPGIYTGNWQLTNAAGFSFGQLTVVINMPAPTATFTNTALPPTATATFTPVPPTNTPVPPTATNTPAGPTTITLNPSSQGGIHTPSAVFSFPNAGDDASNSSYQGFATFNLGGIPSGATVTSVKLDLTPFDQLGNAFVLGCLRVYQQNYGTLDASDFFTGSALGAFWRFCSAGDITSASAQSMDSSGIATFQASLASGQFQIRLQFNEQATNNDGADNLLRPTPKLIVTYTGP